MIERSVEIDTWLQDILGPVEFSIERASADASFRRYFRVQVDGSTHIVMDAPPDKEDCGPFIDVAARLAKTGIVVPMVIRHDKARGLLLLTDLGEELYLDRLCEDTVDRLYQDAIRTLVTMQQRTETRNLPRYDKRMLRSEMALFYDWLVIRHLGIKPDRDQQAMLDDAFERLEGSASEQPQTFVHRDYHSRNLIWRGTADPGVIDFQDAVVGPVTYDLVSLLRDCYIRWPAVRVQGWCRDYLDRARDAGVLSDVDPATFRQWFDLMGVQRHLKASGIFARLYHRDGKAGYLRDVPRTLGYIVETAKRYPSLDGLGAFVSQVVLPTWENKEWPCGQ